MLFWFSCFSKCISYRQHLERRLVFDLTPPWQKQIVKMFNLFNYFFTGLLFFNIGSLRCYCAYILLETCRSWNLKINIYILLIKQWLLLNKYLTDHNWWTRCFSYWFSSRTGSITKNTFLKFYPSYSDLDNHLKYKADWAPTFKSVSTFLRKITKIEN